MADGAVDKELLKKIKIKSGVVKRLTKEVDYYEKEAKKLVEKVEKMKAENADEHDIKKQTEVAQESESMIPDTRRRLKTAIEDLKSILSGISPSDQAMFDTEDYKTAQVVLQDAVDKSTAVVA